ncbi:MAG: preprotein translocase subunit SecE [Chloroflexota bacterium]
MPSTRAPSTKLTARPASRQRPARAPIAAAGRRLGLGQGGQGLLEFVRELRAEIRKVIWPTRKEAINMTVVVIAMSAALGAFLGGVDYLFQELFRLLLQSAGVAGY